MKPQPPVVTLSDSLTSPAPRRKTVPTGKGSPKVVCIDSDTDSDGSYTNPPANNLYSKASVTSCFTANGPTGGKDSASNFCATTDEPHINKTEWQGLRQCNNNVKPWSPSISLSFEKELKDDVTDVNAVDKPDYSFGVDRFGAKHNNDANLKHQTDKKTVFDWDDPPSPKSVSSFDVNYSPHAGGKPLEKNKDILHVGQPQKKISDGSDSCSTSTLSLSPAHEIKVRNEFSSEPVQNNKNASLNVSTAGCSDDNNSLSKKSRYTDIEKSKETSTTRNSYLNLLSDESDDTLSLPKWDEQLKGIISSFGSSKGTNANVFDRQKQPFDDKIRADSGDSMDSHGAHSYSKRKHGKFDLENSDDAEVSDTGDSRTLKKQKNYSKMAKGDFRSSSIDNDDFMEDPETATQRHTKGRSRKGVLTADVDVLKTDMDIEKQVKQTKDITTREADRKLSKEERENLKREKQEEKRRQQEARKLRNEEEKRRKEQLKVEAAERRKYEKEKVKWEKGKFALQNITAFVDTKILEGGLIGGHLLTRFAEKGLNYQLVQNPVTRTVIWQMKVPSCQLTTDSQCQDSNTSNKTSAPQLFLKDEAVSYVLVVFEAEDFINMVTQDNLDKHIKDLQRRYPGFTLCYLVNKLMRHLHKREQEQYKKPDKNWTRPPVEQVLARLVTSYDGVHSRLCVDEAEVADHIVGLTRSLAECPFKRKLSSLSLNANGDHVVKNDPNSDVIKKNIWLKALVALPKVSGACAIAIAKKYPSMSSLFEAYLDPSRTVHEKEYLLQDLVKEGLLGGDSNRRIGPACSKRVYRIFMAQQGNLHTDDVEEGADRFRDT